MSMYVPILKGKEGEFSAVEDLDLTTKLQIMPLFEVPQVPYDYANDRPLRSLAEHVALLPARLLRCWGAQRPVFLDMPWSAESEEKIEDWSGAWNSVLKACRTSGVLIIPVVSRTTPTPLLEAIGANMPADNSHPGVCIRLTVSDADEDVNLDEELVRLLTAVKCPTKLGDVLIDLGEVGSDLSRVTLLARSMFQVVPAGMGRRLILAASSFPQDLSEVNASEVTRLARVERRLWLNLRRRPERLPRPDIIFSDYAVAHPVTKELDPRTMQMSASIRYTADDWLVVKGKNVRRYGFDQYFSLAKTLIELPEYSGQDFSKGDRYIWECAAKRSGPGNATTWRKVATNHHLTYVTRELARDPGV